MSVTPRPLLELKTISISGKIVDLRPHRASDNPFLQSILNDQETMAALQPYFKITVWSDAAIKERFKKLRSDPTWLSFTVFLRDSGRIVGHCGFKHLDLSSRYAEFGLILHRSVWGQGVARECFQLCFDFGFGEIGLSVIGCTTDEHNHRMRAFFGKVGIMQDGIVEAGLYFPLKSEQWPSVRSLMTGTTFSKPRL